MFKFSIAYFFAAVQSRREENGDKNEKKTLTNPITNKEMNKLLVCVRYDTNNIETRELVSYIVGE